MIKQIDKFGVCNHNRRPRV